MATIQINRTKTGVVPSSLADGELYIDQLNGLLYWANSTGVVRSTALILPIFAPSATTDTTNANNITSGQLASAQGGMPPGAVMAFAMSAPPSGWLECNGGAVSRSTYSALFTAVGTTWGVGDGSTTFNVPDFRGQFLRGWDHGAGVDSGRSFASSQADDNKSHTHTVTDPGHHHTPSGGSSFWTNQTGGSIGPGGASGLLAVANTSSDTTGITIGNTGVEARPKNRAILYCIKT